MPGYATMSFARSSTNTGSICSSASPTRATFHNYLQGLTTFHNNQAPFYQYCCNAVVHILRSGGSGSSAQKIRTNRTITLFRVIPTMTFQNVHLGQIYSDILSGKYSGILSDVYSDILSGSLSSIWHSI